MNLKIELFLSMGFRVVVDFEASYFKGKCGRRIIVHAAECNAATVHMLSVIHFLYEIVSIGAHDELLLHHLR